MTETVTRKDSEMSEQRSKEAEMSSVAEMSLLVREVADFAAPSPNWKDRVNAASRILKLPFGRVKSLYYGDARRVEAEEMDRARAAARELRERQRVERENAHLAWLSSELGRLRETGEEFHGPHIDALERVLRGTRGDRSSLALREAAEAVPAASAAEE
jgi:hypothetical protein